MSYPLISLSYLPVLRLKEIYLKRMHLSHILMLLLSVILIYYPVIRFGFLIGWDDQWLVINHYTEDGFTWRNLYAIITDYYYGQYAPVNQIYYTALYSIFKYNPVAFHIAEVFIHLANVILVYFLLNIISPGLISQSVIKIRQISFLTAFLIAVLPVNIEPVAWIAASKVTIYALFYLISLICYCKYLKTFKPGYYYFLLLFFLLSFGAKEQAITLPFCLLLFDVAYNRNIKTKIVWLEKLPLFILAFLFGIITFHSQEMENSERIFYPIYQRVPLAAFTFSEYFTKCLFPVNLSYLYPFPFQEGEKVPYWLWMYVLIIPLIFYFLYVKIRVKWVFFSLVFFSIHIMLVVNFFSLGRFSFIADRYLYIAAIGLCFLASTLYINSLHSKPLLIAGLLYIAMITIYSHFYVTTWTNAQTLKTKLIKTIEGRPDFNELKNKINASTSRP